MNKQIIYQVSSSALTLGFIIGQIISNTYNDVLMYASILNIISNLLWYLSNKQYYNTINNLPDKDTINDMAQIVNDKMSNYINDNNKFEQGFKKGVEYIYYKLSSIKND